MNEILLEREHKLRPAARLEHGEACASLFDARWDDLLRRQPLPNPTLSATWLTHLVEWESGAPVAIVVEQGDDLVAAGAFGLYRPMGRLGPTLARWLGDDRQWFSPDLLVDQATPTAGATLIDALLGVADGIHLPAGEDGVTSSALKAHLPWLAELRGAEGWISRVPPPRLSRVQTRFEKDCRRATRRGTRVDTRVHARPDEVLDALERLFVLHAARWCARGGEIPRFSTTERHRAWYRRLVGAMAERGEVCVAEVSENGSEVAIDLGFVAGRGAAAHTTAIRLGGNLKEPGHASQLALLRALEARGVDVVDLGWGAGDAGGPKASVGPTPVIVKRFIAADSRRSQRALEGALALKNLVRTRRWRRFESERP